MGDIKDDRLEIRLSKKEKEDFKRKATELGMSVSSYLRMLVEAEEEPDKKD